MSDSSVRKRRECDMATIIPSAEEAALSEQLIQLLKKSVEEFNLYRLNHPGPVDLRGAELSGLDISRADLSNANLWNAHLALARLNGADLTDAYLANADLHQADLQGSSLIGANLMDANLESADLTGARGLATTILYGVSWSGCKGARREIVQASMLLTQATIEFAKE
jgi:uncharacterized protein YjbI with pentapeptide repeats